MAKRCFEILVMEQLNKEDILQHTIMQNQVFTQYAGFILRQIVKVLVFAELLK